MFAFFAPGFALVVSAKAVRVLCCSVLVCTSALVFCYFVAVACLLHSSGADCGQTLFAALLFGGRVLGARPVVPAALLSVAFGAALRIFFFCADLQVCLLGADLRVSFLGADRRVFFGCWVAGSESFIFVASLPFFFGANHPDVVVRSREVSSPVSASVSSDFVQIACLGAGSLSSFCVPISCFAGVALFVSGMQVPSFAVCLLFDRSLVVLTSAFVITTYPPLAACWIQNFFLADVVPSAGIRVPLLQILVVMDL